MKNSATIVVAVFTVFFLGGCGATSREIHARSQGTKTDIFTEVREGVAIPRGLAEMTIKASIKTHTDGYYILESRSSLHGKAHYPFVLNIDGQAIRWEVAGTRDEKPVYDAAGKASPDPDAGVGMKYILEKRLRMKAGTHKIFIGLPEEKYACEVEVSLKEGETGILEFKPAYRMKTVSARMPTFKNGLVKYKVFLNGALIPCD